MKPIKLRKKHLLYIPLIFIALIWLLPLYVMLITGFKGFEEISLKTMWNLPAAIQFDNFTEAYTKLAPNLWNSINMVLPAAIISSILGSLNGYLLSKWKFKGADVIFPLILFGMFIPYQAILIPLVQFMKAIDLYGGLPGLANLGAPDQQPLYPARPGAKAVIQVTFTAPSDSDTYSSSWQAFDPQGQAFGDLIFIEIVVP